MVKVSPSLFRALVVLSAIPALIGPALFYVFRPPLSIDHSAWLFPGASAALVVFGALNLLFGIATTIGLFLFHGWSRPAALITVVTGTVLYSLCAYVLDPGIKVATDSLADVLGGAVIALAYCLPLAHRFTRAI